ncbi:hypothetical protein GCM10010270_28690 [Streptomyces violaceus]|nr:hypothetical protein GCM10010270_28690 [Streptomyces janthinus]
MGGLLSVCFPEPGWERGRAGVGGETILLLTVVCPENLFMHAFPFLCPGAAGGSVSRFAFGRVKDDPIWGQRGGMAVDQKRVERLRGAVRER